jgi:NTP pyrophosphatase (non-canonical NTP hydrolase)
MYYIYHIPGKKIGVTRNLKNRVTLIQGYKEDEYEVLEQSDDIDYISDREIELQKSYGYKVDMKKYKNLKFNKMKINATSMFNNGRSYIYNKAFYEAYFNPEHTPAQACCGNTSERFDLIRDWAATRGLYDEGDSNTQYVKLQEEAGELAKALLKNDQPEIVDAIGDIVVVLTNLAHLQGYDIEYCIDEAYKVIANRTGKMINGTFVKDK